MKKIISVILSICLACGLLVTPIRALSSENVKTKLNSVLEEFPAGSYFTTDGKNGSPSELTKIMKARGMDTAGYDRSYTCVGFAKYVWARVFNHTILSAYRDEYSSGRANESGVWANTKVGDLVYFYKNSDLAIHSKAENGFVKDPYVHAAIVYDVSDTGVTLYDCNFKGSNQIGLYTVNFGGGGWPKNYCRLYRAKDYDDTNDNIMADGTIYAADIVSIAESLVGKYPYVSGGESPSEGGFDCTGLVYYIYHTRLGYDMTITQARSKSLLLAMGTKITSKDDLLPGDIIQYTISHVGIYIGNGNVIQSGTSLGLSKISINSKGLTFSYGIRLPGIIQTGTSGTVSSSPEPAKASTESGDWIVTIPAGYKLLCYDSATAVSSNGIYVREQSSAYRISCSQKAALPNGTVRYYGEFDSGRNHYWFELTDKMTVSGSEPVQTKTYSVIFDACGGSVSQQKRTISEGDVYGALPVPSKSGYNFEGWYTDANGGAQVKESDTISGNITLYAHWSAVNSTTITFSSLTTPVKLKVGESGHVDGYITSSDSPIVSVKAEIYARSTGQVVMEASSSGFRVSTYGPMKNSKIDANLTFGDLSSGSYFIKYTATTENGTVASETTGIFFVVSDDNNSGTWIEFNSLTTPGTLTKGKGGHVNGSITAHNSPIVSVKAAVINSSTGQTVLTASSSGFSVYTYGPIKGSKIDTDLKFGKLSRGTYYIEYTVTTADGTSSVQATTTFDVI